MFLIIPEKTAAYIGLSDYLSQQILALIRSENLVSGSRLPSVKELSKRFSVAAPTIREALRGLEAMGMLSIRHGSGIYVEQSSERLMLINPYYPKLEFQTLIDLLEARLLIEPRLAELAAQYIDEANLAELESLLEKAEGHLFGNEEDDNVLQQVNKQFHSSIAACSKNAVLSQVTMSLHDLHFQEQIAIFYLYNNPSKDHSQHVAIFEALQQRNPRLASKLMRQHLENVKAIIEHKQEGR